MRSYVEVLGSGHLRVPLLRLLLCRSQIVPISDNVLRHYPVSALFAFSCNEVGEAGISGVLCKLLKDSNPFLELVMWPFARP